MNKTVTSQRQITIKRRYIKHSGFLKASAPAEATLLIEARSHRWKCCNALRERFHPLHTSVCAARERRKTGSPARWWIRASLFATPAQDAWGEQAPHLPTSFGDRHRGTWALPSDKREMGQGLQDGSSARKRLLCDTKPVMFRSERTSVRWGDNSVLLERFLSDSEDDTFRKQCAPCRALNAKKSDTFRNSFSESRW